MKKWIVSMAAVGLIFALSACGAKEAPKASEPANGNSAAQQVKLVATNFQFDQKEYKVKKGEDVTFSLENKQGMHAVQISGVNVGLDNNNKTKTVKIDKAGTYDIICSLPCGQGHATMKSKLIVE
ncbi:cupredoxin domain-containing protein [Paenibacillus sp. MZ04-78.2]|uniref:cupredoxin domain-containing protein n=1 Tax=Paenibacillus sp. MZ04-78.2 TaxID=2962034 RepID=UPI0020B85CCF|nr:cupredoxin domain-containing protein [Paenibacillus sp. MZ04-78.2]MCP3773691.1 cupredoxin domain-containing protein [Paenibacillus sp. MZ04-78.2]